MHHLYLMNFRKSGLIEIKVKIKFIRAFLKLLDEQIINYIKSTTC